VQISDPWLTAAVLELGTRRPDLVDKPRGFPLPIYDCFDRARPRGRHALRSCPPACGATWRRSALLERAPQEHRQVSGAADAAVWCLLLNSELN